MRTLIDVEIRDKEGETLVKLWPATFAPVMPDDEWELVFRFREIKEG